MHDPFSCSAEDIPEEYQLETIDLHCSVDLKVALKKLKF